ncbi:MAG: PHP domain-containing protein [Bacilli bacterium]|nr:PHP domain-containing protein [Acholeplasmataceae bacterium]MDY2902655.1 PHP domain-containing protein [Bacilli bacterium]
MNRISNYHSHIYLCGHATGDVEDYVKEAIKWGYKEIGISDHGPIPESFVGAEKYKLFWLDRFMTLDKFKNVYLKSLEEAKKKYSNINILKGLEIEYIPNHDDYYQMLFNQVDYLNYGVHFFYNGQTIIDTYLEMTENDMEYYAKNVEEALSKGWFSCLVHPDLYLYHVKTFTKFHEQIARSIISSCIKYNVYLEINANGKDKYPRIEFWNIVKEYKDAKIIIGSDAHKIEDFHGENVKRVMEFAKALSLNIQEKMVLKEHKQVIQK